MKKTVTAKQAIRFLLICTTAVLFFLMASLNAMAATENPLQKENIKIKLLDDFKNYTDIKDVLKNSLSTGSTENLSYENGSLKILGNGEWQDQKFANYGLAQRRKMPGDTTTAEAGSFVGAQGIGVRIKIESISTFTVYFAGQTNGTSSFFQLKPDAPYYVVSPDGVTNKALAVDTGYGFGTMSTLPANENFEGFILVPFTSLYDASSASKADFNPEQTSVTHMLYKIFGGTPDKGVVLYSLFLYGEEVESFRENEIRDCFKTPDLVTSPADYSVPQNILDLRKNNSGSLNRIIKVIFITVGAFAVLTAGTVVVILSPKKRQNHRKGKGNES